MGTTAKLQISVPPAAERSRALTGETSVLRRASRGFRLFPVEARGKRPLITEWPVKATSDPEALRTWMNQYPACNWGLACGVESGVFVLDLDGAGGEAAVRELIERHGDDWTKTLSVKTARGMHSYFKYPERAAIRNSTSKLAPGLDVRGEVGYVLVPPSVHPNGAMYQWAGTGEDAPIMPAPAWLLEMLTAPAQPMSATPAVGCGIIPKGQRNATLAKLAGVMRRRGMSPKAIEAALLTENAVRCQPKLLEAEVSSIAHSISRYQAASPTTKETRETLPVSESRTDGGSILQDVVSMIRRFVGVSDAQAVVIGLWVLHTHAVAASDVTPYVAITSAEKRCGKTRLLEVLALLVFNPWLTGRVSAACLFRKIDAQKPTLLLDESDAAFNGEKEYAEALRGVLNTGHRRGGQASCCAGQGANITFRDFHTFCPKAIAGIGKLPDTVADRSMPIRLKRKAPGERVERFRHRTVEGEARAVRERVATWAAEKVNALREMRPAIPDALNDRQQDGCEPLLALADAVGGEWMARARAAVVELLGGTAAEDQSAGVRLLADIRDIFEATGSDKLCSEELKDKLVEIESSQWAEWNKGKPITAIGLSRLLKPFEIKPRTIRLSRDTCKGYLKESFLDAWTRYLPPVSPSTDSGPSHPSQVSIHAGNARFLETTQEPLVTGQKSEKSPTNMRTVTHVTGQLLDQAPQTGAKRQVVGEL
jgi:Protein of unknown function (DUF3631)/Bifunctional DNA primase/polymerase, N-terminal/Primase C terminal 1 (PriCT-1)